MYTLSYSRPMPLSCRNQSIDLLCKSIDWFQYNGNIVLKWVNRTTGDGWIKRIDVVVAYAK